jgi:hypothetical protein
VVLLAIQIFWFVESYRQGEQLQDWFTLQMKALRSFQTSVNIYHSTPGPWYGQKEYVNEKFQ